MANPWIVKLKAADSPRMAVVAFHYAGGSAGVFSKWSQELPAYAELWAIQLPGRWERIQEPFVTDVVGATREICAAVTAEVTAPIVLLGYSLGALFAYEAARILEPAGRITHLLALARSAPHCGTSIQGLIGLPDSEFLEAVQSRYGGVSAEILADPEMRELFVPIVRADLEAYERYRYVKSAPLKVPVTAWAGDKDATIPPEALEMWGETTSGPFRHRRFAGPHFFTESNPGEFFPALRTLLDGVRGG